MKRRAAALMVVLWVLAVLVVVCLAIGSSVRFRQVSLRRDRADFRSSQALASAVSAGEATLLADPASEDTLQDAWAVSDPDRFAFEVSERKVTLHSWVDGSARPGLADESARINANTADAETLAALPGMTSAAAEALLSLRQHIVTADPARAESPFRTEAELLSALDEAVQAGGGISYVAADVSDEFSPAAVGLNPAALEAARYLTLYSRQRNVDADGRPRVNLNAASWEHLRTAFGEYLTDEQLEAIVLTRQEAPLNSIGELLTRELSVLDDQGDAVPVEISVETFRQVADRMTTSDRTVLPGLVNVNTAPVEVLRALPELDSAEAEAIVEARTQDGPRSSLAWLLDVLSPETFAASCNRLTTRSQQFRMCAEVEAADGPLRRATAVLERDGGRCVVLAWTTWQAGSDESTR